MSPKETSRGNLIDRLIANGWEVREGDRSKLVVVSAEGILHCVDGRRGNYSGKAMRGPKLQGSVFGVAALLNDCSRRGIETAIARIKQAGIIPSVHEDDHAGPLGCGFARLLNEGKLTGMPRLGVSVPEVGNMVRAVGGPVVVLNGKHSEQVVRVNMVAGTTLEPDGSGFILDAWIAGRLGLNQQRLLENAIETVQLLNGPKVIELYQ